MRGCIQAIFIAVAFGDEEKKCLSALHDALLPRLMSGDRRFQHYPLSHKIIVLQRRIGHEHPCDWKWF